MVIDNDEIAWIMKAVEKERQVALSVNDEIAVKNKGFSYAILRRSDLAEALIRAGYDFSDDRVKTTVYDIPARDYILGRARLERTQGRMKFGVCFTMEDAIKAVSDMFIGPRQSKINRETIFSTLVGKTLAKAG